MKQFATAVILSLLGMSTTSSAGGQLHQDMIYDFGNIQPSTDLTWTPCFDGFTCSRLEVPLDHSNKTTGTTSIAFIKLAGSNATADSPSIVVLPGGPGGSGVQLLLSGASLASRFLGGQYNIVSFDPRGVNNSGPNLDCFYNKTEARQAFSRLYSTGVTNVSSVSLEEQYYSSSIYGDWCNHAVETEFPHGYYVTTPAVAQDLLAFTEAEARLIGKQPSTAKLWAYGISYGTVTGATFAAMFPDRVGRMILDGLLDADLYYRNDWSASLDQMDEAMTRFSSLCHSAGPSRCSFWGPTPGNITARLDSIIRQLQNHPVPIAEAQSQGIPVMVTYTDLKALFLNAVYNPILEFPTMADILHQVEHGNVSALAGLYGGIILEDAGIVIRCVDSYRTNSLTSFENFKHFAAYAAQKSKYIGDLWAPSVGTILCRAMRPQLPESMVIRNTTVGTDSPTSFPIVFASNTIDPITPLISAQKSSARFPGSVLLLQEGIGHTIVNQGPTDCYIEHVQAYYRGVVPPANTKCSAQNIPFVGGPA